MPTHHEYDVLALYNHDDVSLVNEICDHLEHHNLRCLVATEDPLVVDWQQEIVQVAERVRRAVVIFFGPSGVAKWQSKEWRHIYETCLDNNTRMIAVLVGNVSLPNLFGLRDIPRIDFRVPDDPRAQSRLRQAVVGARDGQGRAGEYSIHIAVQANQDRRGRRTCLLALRDPGDPTLRKILLELTRSVAKDDLVVMHSGNFHPSESERTIYLPHAVKEVRAASVVVADCTIDPATGKPDADVTFILGIANSVSKPVVLVTDNKAEAEALYKLRPNALVEYDRTKLKGENEWYTIDLAARIASELERVLREQRHPFLIDDGRDDEVAVAFADVFLLRVTFWNRLRAILRFRHDLDSALQRAFVSIGTLHYLAKHSYWQVTALSKRARKEEIRSKCSSCSLFSDVFKRFDLFRERMDAHYRRLDESREAAKTAFDLLLENTSGNVQSLVERSSTDFHSVNSLVASFRESYDQLGELIANVEKSIEAGQILVVSNDVQILKAHMEGLALKISDLGSHTSRMMLGLLNLIGHGREPEENLNDGTDFRLN